MRVLYFRGGLPPEKSTSQLDATTAAEKSEVRTTRWHRTNVTVPAKEESRTLERAEQTDKSVGYIPRSVEPYITRDVSLHFYFHTHTHWFSITNCGIVRLFELSCTERKPFAFVADGLPLSAASALSFGFQLSFCLLICYAKRENAILIVPNTVKKLSTFSLRLISIAI